MPGDVYATITGGSVSGFGFGILLTTDGSAVHATIGGGIQIQGGGGADLGIGIVGANASADIGNAVVDDPLVGILINGGSATINGATVTGNTTGIEVESGGKADISNATIYANTVGVDFIGGATGSLSDNTFLNAVGAPAPNTIIDLDIESTAGAVSDLGGNAFYSPVWYIADASPQNIDATGDSFNGFTPATDATPAANLATYYGIEDHISDYLDHPSAGYVKIKTGYDFLAHSSESTTPGPLRRRQCGHGRGFSLCAGRAVPRQRNGE